MKLLFKIDYNNNRSLPRASKEMALFHNFCRLFDSPYDISEFMTMIIGGITSNYRVIKSLFRMEESEWDESIISDFDPDTVYELNGIDEFIELTDDMGIDTSILDSVMEYLKGITRPNIKLGMLLELINNQCFFITPDMADNRSVVIDAPDYFTDTMVEKTPIRKSLKKNAMLNAITSEMRKTEGSGDEIRFANTMVGINFMDGIVFVEESRKKYLTDRSKVFSMNFVAFPSVPNREYNSKTIQFFESLSDKSKGALLTAMRIR